MIKRVETDIKNAMKEKNNSVRDILRMVLSKAKLIAKNEKNREMQDKDITSAIQKQIKQNKETISCLREGNRDTSKEEFEIQILSKYLPEQMSLEKMKELVTSIVEDIPAEDRTPKARGIVMGKLSKYKNVLDMKEAGAFAATLLK